MWTRRETIFGGALTILWGAGATCAHGQTIGGHQLAGCMLPDPAANILLNRSAPPWLSLTGNEELFPKSGDNHFDYALAHTLSAMSELMHVLPGFCYFDDSEGENAYATNRVRLNRGDGTVLMGQRLLRRLMRQKEHPDVSVAAVCAHEFGHILQYKRGLTHIVGAGQPTVKRVELQADFFAGYFAGVRKLSRPQFPAAVFALTQYNFGDNMVNSPKHHGRPDERAAAIVQGFEAGFRERRSLDQAIGISINYVKQL
jgi:hypothetical protein